MRELLFLGSIMALYIPHLLSPGPNFLVLTRVAATESRRHGLATAVGITSASTLYATLAVTGIGLLVTQSPTFRITLQLAGGIYLLYKGLRMFRRSELIFTASKAGGMRQSLRHAYCNGLLTNLTNPQAIVFFASIFAALLSADLPSWVKPAGVLVVAASSISVNLVTVMLFSFEGVQKRYLQAKTWIDRLSGCLLAGFGMKLMMM